MYKISNNDNYLQHLMVPVNVYLLFNFNAKESNRASAEG
jgi:hypothetical protein